MCRGVIVIGSLSLTSHVLSDRDTAGVTGGICLHWMEHPFRLFWVPHGAVLYTVFFAFLSIPPSKFKTQQASERRANS